MMKKALFVLHILVCSLACALSLGAEDSLASGSPAVSDQGNAIATPAAATPADSSAETASSVPATPKRVAVTILPFKNSTGVDSYDAASGMAMDILTFSLKSLSECDVSVLQADPVERTDDALGAWSAASGIDVVLYGEIVLASDDTVRVKLSAYNRERGKTLMSDETAAVPVLEIFSVCDALSLSVASEMTGTHIGFARINFVNSGEQGSYEVAIDGVSVGRDLASIAGWREGFHEIVVRQDRMLGGHELARQSVTLVEGVPCAIKFSVPRLLPEEKKRISDLEGEIQSLWDVKGSESIVDRDLADYSGLFARLDYCPALFPYRDKAAKLVASREAYMRDQQVRVLTGRVTALETENERISKNLAELTDEIRSRLPQSQKVAEPAAAAKSEKPAPSPWADETPTPPPTPTNHKNYRAMAIGSLVVAVVGIAVGALGYSRGKEAYNDYQEASTIDAAQSARTDSERWGTVTLIGAGVGCAGLISAPIFFLLDARQHRAEKAGQ
jgi:TolB-like protein